MKNRPYPLSVTKLAQWELSCWTVSHGNSLRSRKLPVYRAVLLGLLVLLVAGAMAGCAAAPTPTPTPTQTPPSPPTGTVAPSLTPTAIVLPSDTPTEVPTAITVPTDTATPVPPLAVAQDGVTAWCVSFRDPNPLGGTPDAPSYARMGKVVNGVLNLNVSRGSCTFVFTFNQTLPAGTELQALNASGDQAWTKAALAPVSSNPKQGFATLNHPMLNNPSYWQITYPFALVASDGSILWKSNVLLSKTFPGMCWEGSTPDPVTLFCPLRDTDFIPHYTPVTPGK
jgi:hypothetical protein